MASFPWQLHRVLVSGKHEKKTKTRLTLRVECPLVLSDLNQNWILRTDFSESRKSHPVRVELCHDDVQTDMKKRMGTFAILVNAPRSCLCGEGCLGYRSTIRESGAGTNVTACTCRGTGKTLCYVVKKQGPTETRIVPLNSIYRSTSALDKHCVPCF
jgi:hypothetical protein